MSAYQPVIGLEVHVQLATKTKAFCSCPLNTRTPENQNICEICTGQPGALPIPNIEAVRYGVMLSHALECKINNPSFFDRKNYFYPDLAKGFQISQFSTPLSENGTLEIETQELGKKTVRIERVQIEEDTGKSIHEGESSLIDYNRCGTPLLEVVGMPDLRSAKEASQYLKNLHSILVYLGICKGNLQEGNFRVDVNLSLMPKGSTTFGTRTETKNLNSFRNVEKAIEAEIIRQEAMLSQKQKIVQQTLNFNGLTGKISVLRTKSDAHDYRYFPEPDLLPVDISEDELQSIKESLPELPSAKKSRFIQEYVIPEYDASVLTSEKYLADYFETATKNYKGPAKKVSNWIMVELLKLLKEFSLGVEKSPVPASELSDLLNFVHEDKISGSMAKTIFEQMFETKKTAKELVSALGCGQISDNEELEKIVKKVLDQSPQEVERFKAGEKKLLGVFVGMTMKASKGKANPKLVNQIINKLLSN